MVYRPPAPIVPPLAGSPQQQAAQLAEAISRKADQTLEPVYTAVNLVAPGGAVWRLSVSDAGVLQLAVVLR